MSKWRRGFGKLNARQFGVISWQTVGVHGGEDGRFVVIDGWGELLGTSWVDAEEQKSDWFTVLDGLVSGLVMVALFR